MRDYIVLYLNGERRKLRGKEVFMTLSDYLRSHLLTGTKVVCEEGDCGACTVMKGDLVSNKLDYKTINSCITFMHLLDCSHIVTVEGLSKASGARKVQDSMVECHGAQCGFCTPGIVMSLVDMAQAADKKITEKKVKNCLAGNLCRCTGYDSIIKAGTNIDFNSVKNFSSQFAEDQIIKDFSVESKNSIEIEFGENKFYAPVKLSDVIKLNQQKEMLVKSSATDLGVQINKERLFPKSRVSLSQVKSLYEISQNEDFIIVGAKVSLTILQDYVEEIIPEFYELLKIFASPQIKNAATLVGNIANASPIGDTIPFLMVSQSELELTGPNGKRRVNINDFYTGYKQMDMSQDELITNVFIRKPVKNEVLKLYKVSKRKDLDISCVTAGFRLKLKDESNVIESVDIALGGVGATVLKMQDSEHALLGKDYKLEEFEKTGALASKSIAPMSDVRGSEEYRRILVRNMYTKFYLDSSVIFKQSELQAGASHES